MSPVTRDRRRAVLRLALFALAIAAGFAAVTLAGFGPDDARRWVDDAGAAGPLVFVLVAAALGLVLFPGHVTAAAAGVLFGTLRRDRPDARGRAARLDRWRCLVARHLGADALHSLLGPRARRRQAWVNENGFAAVLACRLAPGRPGRHRQLPGRPVRRSAPGLRRRGRARRAAEDDRLRRARRRALGPGLDARRDRRRALRRRRGGRRGLVARAHARAPEQQASRGSGEPAVLRA